MDGAMFADARGTQGLVSTPLINSSNQTLFATTQGAQVASVATANAGATYDATAQTLINELKAQVNALLVELRLKRFPTT